MLPIVTDILIYSHFSVQHACGIWKNRQKNSLREACSVAYIALVIISLVARKNIKQYINRESLLCSSLFF